MPTQNPLLEKTHLPLFHAIQPQHIVPAITYLIKRNSQEIAKLLKQPQFTWENLMTPLTLLNEELNFVWATIRHLQTVMDTKELRQAYLKVLPQVSRYFTQLQQNLKFYRAIKTLAHQPLNPIQRKIIKDLMLDFRLHGIELKPQQQKKLRHLQQKLLTLTNQFAHHVLDATNEWYYLATAQEISGIPPNDLSLAQKAAHALKKKGWLFTLDAPSYLAVITYANSRTLRKKLYTAYITRASELGNPRYDNRKIMREILKTRVTLAKLLGFKNYAALSLATKMLHQPQRVISFLKNLVRATKKTAQREYQELAAFAKRDSIKHLQPWDIAHYSEKLRHHKYHLAQEELRAYFPLAQVLTGMFKIAQRLFGITIKEQKEFSRWHRDVRLFKIYTKTRKLAGEFYTDLYARKNKQSGAWMERVRSRMRNAKIIITPAAYLNCNFTPPINGHSLLTHEEVQTLFHEFGHCLQHLLTQIDYPEVSGINGVPCDAVELPSQLLENWTWEPSSVKLVARHYQTHKTLSPQLQQQLYRSQKFQAGLKMLRQLEFALFDLTLHLTNHPQVQKTLNTVRRQVRIVPWTKFDRMPNSFLHIFADDYAAGYYSYKWAEVMAVDVFSQFKHQGIFNSKIGTKFLNTILTTGGSADALELFKRFCGRVPKITALLKHYGIRKT